MLKNIIKYKISLIIWYLGCIYRNMRFNEIENFDFNFVYRIRLDKVKSEISSCNFYLEFFITSKSEFFISNFVLKLEF